ncbi:MAG: hypothetical protein ACYCOU_07870 [Sulfobacillus sp.]
MKTNCAMRRACKDYWTNRLKFIKFCIYATFFKLIELRTPSERRMVYFEFPNFRLCVYSSYGEVVASTRDIETILRTDFVIALQRKLGQVFFDIPIAGSGCFTLRDSSNRLINAGTFFVDNYSVQQNIAVGKPVEVVKVFRRMLSNYAFPDEGTVRSPMLYIQTAFDAISRDPAFETAPFGVLDGAE